MIIINRWHCACATPPGHKQPAPPLGGELTRHVLKNAAVARLTGLEPATLGVTGRYSNQLSYNRPLHALPLTSKRWAVIGSGPAPVKRGFHLFAGFCKKLSKARRWDRKKPAPWGAGYAFRYRNRCPRHDHPGAVANLSCRAAGAYSLWQ